jgi:hypothetical protein
MRLSSVSSHPPFHNHLYFLHPYDLQLINQYTGVLSTIPLCIYSTFLYLFDPSCIYSVEVHYAMTHDQFHNLFTPSALPSAQTSSEPTRPCTAVRFKLADMWRRCALAMHGRCSLCCPEQRESPFWDCIRGIPVWVF